MTSGFTDWIVETDAKKVVDAILNPSILSLEHNVIEDIADILASSDKGKICFHSRDGNGVAHFLASLALINSDSHVWSDV
ncbi:reverse transcriptase-like protein, partial [Proteus mirabilis]|uniref:reverse transcriptase-like protein n=1 Tax=Proteus mirabilis TaxID=584 RepID=UPI0015C572F5